jgi:hypothetical protein
MGDEIVPRKNVVPDSSAAQGPVNVASLPVAVCHTTVPGAAPPAHGIEDGGMSASGAASGAASPP